MLDNIDMFVEPTQVYQEKKFYNKIFKLFKIKINLVTLISMHFEYNVETNFAEYSYIYRFPTKWTIIVCWIDLTGIEVQKRI